MVVTNYTRNLPITALVLPKDDKRERTTIIFSIFYMAELMFTNLYRAVIFNGINFQAVWNEFSFDPVVLLKHFFEVLIRLIIVR